MEQSAEDANCNAADFEKQQNVIVLSKENSKARKYLELPLPCNLIPMVIILWHLSKKNVGILCQTI